jgi:hypothetical protein
VQFLRQSTDSQARTIGPFVFDSDGITPFGSETTISNTDVQLMKNGGAAAAKNSGGGTHRVNGMFSFMFNATDTNTVGELTVSVAIEGALPVWTKFYVLEEVVFDTLFGTSSTGPLTTLGTTAPANWINAAAIASDTITAAKIASAALNGKGDWATAGAAMTLTTGERDTLAGIIDSRLLDGGDATDLIAGIVARLGTVDIDETSLVAAIKAALIHADGITNKIRVNASGAVHADLREIIGDGSQASALVNKLDDGFSLQDDERAGIVAAVRTDLSDELAIIDKLNTTLEADGASGWRFTTLALANAPAGGGGGSGGDDAATIYSYFTAGSRADAFKATGFAVAGDEMTMSLTDMSTIGSYVGEAVSDQVVNGDFSWPAVLEAIAVSVDARLLDAGDATDLIASIVTRIGNTNVDEASFVAAVKAALFDAGSAANKLAVDASGRVTVGTNTDKSGYSLTTAPLDATATQVAAAAALAAYDPPTRAEATSDKDAILAVANPIKTKTDQLTFTVANRIDATVPLNGTGNNAIRINVTNSETSSAIAGAFVSIRDNEDILVAYAVTGTSGFTIFGLDDGAYTALISASGYDAYELDLPVSGIDDFDVPLVPSETGVSEDVDTPVGPYFRLDTAVDWEIPFVIGPLNGISWSRILFTAKTSPTEQEDSEAVLQIQLTSGGDASDGLIVLNGDAVATNDWASIQITDTATGAGKVIIKAIATTEVSPTNQDYWNITDQGLESQRTWRTNSALEPPVIHFDLKRLDGNGKASPNRVEGLLVVAEAVTQDVLE